MGGMTETQRQDSPLALLHDLVAIPSVNRRLAPDGSGETAIAEFCRRWLEQRGFVVEWLEDTPGSPTLVAVVTGTGGGKTLLLNGHLDTVGVESYIGDPFSAVVEDGKIYGRGTFDMKGSLAAMLISAARAARDPVAGTVVVTLVSDEEFGSIGTEEALRWIVTSGLHVDGAVVAEPSELELTIAHRGFAWFELELTGRAAHGSQPERGIDAIAGATALLPALDAWGRTLASGDGHELVGTGTVRVAMISGGVNAATVAPTCRITIERRFLPGEHVDAVEDELLAVIREALKNAPELTFALTRLVARAAFEGDPQSDIVQSLRAATKVIRGTPAVMRGEPFWTDAALIADSGVPCVVFGVDGGGAHSDREWVTADSLEALTSILEATIRDFCG